MKRMPYRVIYNQDCSHLFSATPDEITPAHVDRMVDEVAQGGADLMFINPNTQRVNYPSHVWQTFWDEDEPGMGQSIMPMDTEARFGRESQKRSTMQMKHLADQGCNYLSHALNRCRQAGIAPGVSIRMNDIHNTPWPDAPELSDFYKQHPEWRLQGTYMYSEGPYSVIYALDYRRPEVREHYLALIRELVDDYSFDVLELDFLRTALFFPQGTADQHCAVMTEFLRDVQQMLAGHVSLLVRVPVTPAAAYDLGLDVASWAREDLVDAIAVSAHFNTAWDMELDAFRGLADDGIAFYAGAESNAYAVEGILGIMGLDEDLLRGFAAAQYAGGADGVYVFNFFCAREWTGREPLFAALSELRDPAILRGKPKTYCLMAGGDGAYFGDGDGPCQVPRATPKGRPQAFDILMGPEPAGQQVKVEMIVEGDVLEALEQFRLHINEFSVGKATAIRSVGDAASGKHVQALVFPGRTEMLQAGRNRIVLRNDGVTLTVLQLFVSVQ